MTDWLRKNWIREDNIASIIDTSLRSYSLDTKRWSTDEVSQFLRWLVGILRTEGPLIPYDEFQIDGKLLFKIRKRNLQRLFPESAVDVLWMHVEALKFGRI